MKGNEQKYTKLVWHNFFINKLEQESMFPAQLLYVKRSIS